jgi:tRNA pseudouridine38-40 synthase
MSENSHPENNSSSRVALVIQYVGTNFCGWQRQPNQRTVQEEIEGAIALVLGQPVSLIGAGRTDSGVHAAAQVAHFEDRVSLIPPSRWAAVLNARLPEDILIKASARVSQTWHARFSALWRRYRYTIYNDRNPNLFVKSFSWHYYHAPLQEHLMQAALNSLLGKHHLAAFHRANSARTHSWVEVQGVECYRRGSLVHLEIQANAFLYGMVRLLVGMLVEVGAQTRSLENFVEIWTNQKRDEVRYAAPAKGLCLLRVGYSEFPFPKNIWYDTQPLFNFEKSCFH